MSAPLYVPIREPSQVGEARRRTAALAADIGFPEDRVGEVALAVTELGTNLLAHARGGELFARVVPDGPEPQLELTSVDRGPGIPDVGRALEDGFSTGAGAGTGMGAVRRAADAVEIHGEGGTVVVARFTRGRLGRGGPDGAPELDVAGLVRPHPAASPVSGDRWGLLRLDGGTALVVADGLGHGADAAVASERALETFRSDPWEGPGAALERIHQRLRGTRGAAVGLAEVPHGPGVVRFAGAGNVRGVILATDGDRSTVSVHGTVGHRLRAVREYEYPWAPGAGIVLHTDGLRARWSLSDYPGLRRWGPAVAAAVLYRDFRRMNDDVTVVVGWDRPVRPGGRGAT